MMETRERAPTPSRRTPPRLRSVLLALSLLILLLPLGGISLLRLYDSTLVRQTEAELIGQGVVLVEAYRRELVLVSKERGKGSVYGRPRLHFPPPTDREEEVSRFRPIQPHLDLARDAVGPPAPPARPDPGEGKIPAKDALADEAGRRLADLLQSVQKVTLAGLRIVDLEGRVVASSGTELGLWLIDRSEVHTALEGKAVSALRRRTPSPPADGNQPSRTHGSQENRPRPSLESLSRRPGMRVVVALPVLHGDRVWGAVILTRTPKSVLRELYENRRYFVPGAIVLLLAVTLVSVFGARLLGRPLQALIDQSERVRRGEGTAHPLARPGTLEVHRISVAVAEMARVLQERAEYIATFATNVSHELKTPLTSIHGTVELLRDHLDEMTPEEVERFLTILERDAGRLERLVNRLLELARADVARPGEETTDLPSQLREIARRFAQEGLKIQLSETLPSGQVELAPEVLDSILGNLLDNARQHGGPDVTVTVDVQSLDRRFLLTITDNGPGISEANQGRVFDRFFTTSRDRGGSGLGLAIVKALVQAHGGSISLSSQPGRTRIEIVLSKA